MLHLPMKSITMCVSIYKVENDITLGEMMVSEGFAENFATHLYEDKAGLWVAKTDMQT